MSYDVKALFTSVPIQPAINIIKKLLNEDEQLQQRTSMTVNNITCLLEFCLKSTYFTFQGKHYEQLEEAAMGSPIRPIVANLYMENFEVETINTAPHNPYLWKRYVDDTCTVIKSSYRSEFLEHSNSINEHIQFTSEDQREDESMPFFDILIIPNEDGSLSTTVYRKPTHTDLYLQWDSHHTIPCKYSVIGTLHHRAQTICSNPRLLQQEEDNLHRALTKCKYPVLALNRTKIKTRNPTQKNDNSNKTNSATNNNQNPYIVVHTRES